MPSLALLFHLIEVVDGTATGPVSLEAAQMAAQWCEVLESHARRIYEMAFEGDIESAARLGERLRKKPSEKGLPHPFTVRDVVCKGWSGLSTTEEVERAVNQLEERNWVTVKQLPPGPNGGRPSREIWVNPRILKPGNGEATAEPTKPEPA
jgi:hypothetical protein